MPTDRKSLAARIRAILSKCDPSANATEAERLAAFSKAEELMAKHRISRDDLDPEAEGVESLELEDEPLWGIFVKRELGLRVAEFCHCRAWTSAERKKISFVGMASDTIFADWLISSLVSFIKRAVSDYETDSVLGLSKFVKDDQRGVVLGCCSRLNSRLKEATLNAAARATQLSSSPNALVLVKQHMVDSEYARIKARLDLVPTRGSGGQRGSLSGTAFGQSAANSATFNRPVGGTSGPKLLR